ncbi:putative transcriptional regulator [Methylosinus sp. sav-2]|uniref:CopG family ribbon-helix-helix protein n=1 Tax=Methylosinus sp. sav-2 TaxID=2485168 RepID=UPI00047A4D69|nr:ribbon-helix-helix protein, CopG family [Methylosinus sp. sav-2]TDX65597.1 putative transcriptional regulator [Methylosinus sp. sav-2]
MTASVTVRLDEQTLAALDEMARKTSRSRGEIVARAVEDFVASDARLLEKIIEGLAAADSGDFASDEEVARVRRKFLSSS